MITPRMILAYCSSRLPLVLSPREVTAFCQYLTNLLNTCQQPPKVGRSVNYYAIALATSIPYDRLVAARKQLKPVVDALCRTLAQMPKPLRQHRETKIRVSTSITFPEAAEFKKVIRAKLAERRKSAQKPGPAPRPLVPFPEPLFTNWDEPEGFAAALRLHMKRHGDSLHHLTRALIAAGLPFDRHAIRKWCQDIASPRSIQALDVLTCIESRYRLPKGYFRSKLPHQSRAITGHTVDGIKRAEARRLAWHLPDDFASRTPAEQDEILSWVKNVIISGATDYRRYQAMAMKYRFSVRFRSIQGGTNRQDETSSMLFEAQTGITPIPSVVDAPQRLEDEMTALLSFKTSTLTQLGLQRNGVWNQVTAMQKVEHLGLMFGALIAAPDGAIQGYGARRETLTLAMLVLPSVSDWYLKWRERRRGFYTKWEVDILTVILSLIRQNTGWLWQHPQFATHLQPIPGLVSDDEIAAVQADWPAACEKMYMHGRHRMRELQRVVRVHRDPFEPILPILEAASPVGEYRKIAGEIMRFMPDEKYYPRAAAEAVRSYLMLRFGLHLGLRQRNLRELLICMPGALPTSERRLEDMRRGELRWSDRDNGWEVLIPSAAFKNSTSSFFGAKPFRVILPDLEGLYDMIKAYLDRHRSRLLARAADPGTFFVKTAKASSVNAAYDQNTFYEAWRLTIQRYGIYNPYTGRGAIKGLLPHGPHNIRDVLATHILKQTGSYEQASYAIQDTPDMVAKHYGRFLPQDKTAIAAQILNKVWQAA